jgi:hypothetical protein
MDAETLRVIADLTEHLCYLKVNDMEASNTDVAGKVFGDLLKAYMENAVVSVEYVGHQ